MSGWSSDILVCGQTCCARTRTVRCANVGHAGKILWRCQIHRFRQVRIVSGVRLKHKAIRYWWSTVRLSCWKPWLALRIPLVGHIGILIRCGWWRRRWWYHNGVQARAVVLCRRCRIDDHLGAVIKTIIIIQCIPFWLVKSSVMAMTDRCCSRRVEHRGTVLT